MNYDKERILALTSLKSVLRTSTDLKNEDLDFEFVKNNFLGTEIVSKYYIPDYLYNSKSKTYNHDPRLTSGIYLNHITSEFKKHNDLANVKVPFSWYDWTDLSKDLNKLINLPQKFKPDCSYVCTNYFNKQLQKELEEKIKGTFEEKEAIDPNNDGKVNKNGRKRKSTRYQMQKYSYCRDDNSENQPGFRIFKNHLKSRPDVKALQSKSYLYSEASAPVSLVFLTKNGNLQIEVLTNEESENKQDYGLLKNKMIQNYADSFRANNPKEEVYVDSRIELGELFETIGNIDPVSTPLSLKTYQLDLNHSQFEFDGPQYLNSSPTSSLSKHQTNFQNSIKNSLQTKELLVPKYFEEVLLSRTRASLQGGHFDWRFFSGDVPLDQRQSILSRLLQNWFKLTTNAGLHSWIAHGNLLAYSFNGLNFPWDDDIDVQMPFNDLAKFAERYNGSLIVEDPEEGFGRYFIDVTSSLTHRLKGNGNNHIDARFIDVDTGLFIDITGLAVSASDTSQRFQNRYEKMIRKGEAVEYSDPNYYEGIYEDISRDDMRKLAKENLVLYKQLRQFERENSRSRGNLLKDKSSEERYDINYKLQTYNCRNDHFVSFDELSPLKRSFFEKIPIFVPNNVSAILLDEYKPQRKLSAEHSGFCYLPQIRLWVPRKTVANIVRNEDKMANLNLLTQNDIEKLLKDESIFAEYFKTFDATLVREKEKEIINDESIEQKDQLLSKLVLGKRFPSLRKDVHMLRSENKVAEKFNIKFSKEDISDQIISQLRSEYSKTVDYNILGAGSPQDINFNNYGQLYKDMLKKAQDENYEPDFEMKKEELQQALYRARNNIEREQKQKLLDQLLDTEIKEKFDSNIPKPPLLQKGQVQGVERPKNRPMDEEDDPGVVNDAQNDEKSPMAQEVNQLPRLDVEVDEQKEAEKLKQFEAIHGEMIS